MQVFSFALLAFGRKNYSNGTLFFVCEAFSILGPLKREFSPRVFQWYHIIGNGTLVGRVVKLFSFVLRLQPHSSKRNMPGTHLHAFLGAIARCLAL